MFCSPMPEGPLGVGGSLTVGSILSPLVPPQEVCPNVRGWEAVILLRAAGQQVAGVCSPRRRGCLPQKTVMF